MYIVYHYFKSKKSKVENIKVEKGFIGEIVMLFTVKRKAGLMDAKIIWIIYHIKAVNTKRKLSDNHTEG